jgi:putative pre-16S rRNA nuclease
LALDIGSRRVGVAISDPAEQVVSPRRPLAYGGAGALAEAVARLVGEWAAGGVVVGVPVTRGGSGRGELRVREVVESLRRTLSVPVETADERGTTAEARETLRRAGVPPRRWAGVLDGVAAQLILERYLAARHDGAAKTDS